jgi:hypothetical protein
MPATLTLIASTPIRSQFALDQLNLTYKSDLPWDQTVIDPSVPQKGDPHPTFTFMFVAEVRLQESSARACEFDVLYTGAFNSSGGNPILPGAKRDQSSAVLSASSSKLNTGVTLASPATVQYYGPSTSKSFFTYNAPATSNFADDPTASIVPISLTIGDTAYNATGAIAGIVDSLFTTKIVHTTEAGEIIVGGKYWQNVSRKQKVLQPWLAAVTSGAYISLYSPGVGYTVGNILTISAGGQSATIQVTQVGSIWGDGAGILNWTVTANTFTSAHNALPASGGSGSGAGFNVFIIP